MRATKETGKIFIRNVTVLDAALLDARIGPRGRSWYVDVEIKGIKDDEGIVLDFSDAKKQVKQIIDDAFDHRLIAPATAVRRESTRYVVESGYEIQSKNGVFFLECPHSHLVVVPEETCAKLAQGVTTQMEDLIATELMKSLPSSVVEVKVKLREHEDRAEDWYFTYTHSLRHHKGNCQRFHGHSNIIELKTKSIFSKELSILASKLLADKYLVAEDYVCSADDFKKLSPAIVEKLSHGEISQSCFVSYLGSQGEVRVVIPKDAVILMPSESTIENIADFVRAKVEMTSSVYAYEGLLKGAVSE